MNRKSPWPVLLAVLLMLQGCDTSPTASPTLYPTSRPAVPAAAPTPEMTRGLGSAANGSPTSRAPLDPTTAAVLILDQSIASLGDPHSNVQDVLRQAASQIPQTAQNFIGQEIATFLSRVPVPGRDFPCSLDVVRLAAREKLAQLRDRLLNSSPQPTEPHFCTSVPFALDLGNARGETKTLEIYGYDFDQQPVTFVLLDDGGSFQDVSSALTLRNHYHLSLDLGKNGVQFSAHSQRLGLAWGHLIHATIPLVHADTPLCQSEIQAVPASDGLISLNPPVIHGSANFSALGSLVSADASLDFYSNALQATLCMTALDQGEEQNAVSGCAIETLYTADPSWEIEAILNDTESSIAYTHNPWGGTDTKTGPSSGLVAQWLFSGLDGAGPSDQGPQVQAQLNPLRVIATATGSCISPLAYLEAKRENALSSGTLTRLDPLLTKFPAEILTQRPRFVLQTP